MLRRASATCECRLETAWKSWVAIELDNDMVSRARIGYGSVAPTPRRGHRAEACLVGRPLSDGTIGECVAAARDEIEPITDVRAGAEFRREIVAVTLRRMLESAQRLSAS